MARYLSYILALFLTSCVPDQEEASTSVEKSPAEKLADFGELARSAHPQIKVEGGITGSEVRFSADYSPEKQTLVYELTTPQLSEKIVVSPGDAVRSVKGGADQAVNRESFMPNGKDWPYGSRMVAPFLDAIDGYSATIHSFHISNTPAPSTVKDADQFTWFDLKLNRDQAHDLLLLEFSKVSELKIGVDPKTGLLKSLYSLPEKGELTPTEIRSE